MIHCSYTSLFIFHMSKVHFSVHYSPAAFELYKTSVVQSNEKPGNKDANKLWAIQFSVFEKAIVSYLRARASADALLPVAYSDRRHIRFADAWNRMVNREEPDRWDDGILTEGFGISLSGHDSKMGSYDEFIRSIEDQKFMSCTVGPCNATGQSMVVQMENWKPVLGSYRLIDGKHCFVPFSEEAPHPAVQHVEIPVPSGEILIADWFRIDVFTQAVKSSALPSINTLAGAQQTTQHYAKVHGFLSVCVGNTSPSVFETDGQLRIGSPGSRRGEDEPEGKNLGSVCTDLWWVTAIDRKTLVDIMASTTGPEEAERQVAKYLKDSNGDVVQVQIPPGQALHAYFESEEGLQDRFGADGVNFKGLNTLYAVLSNKPLEWSAVGSVPKRMQK